MERRDRKTASRAKESNGWPAKGRRLEVQASDSTGKITAWHTANFFVDDNTLKPREELQTTCSIKLQC